MIPRVLVTRAAEGASALADALAALGLDPVVVPALEIAPPTSYQTLDSGLQNLVSFDWLLFTSANGVRAFAARGAGSQGGGAAWPAALRVAVIGQATARAAETAGIPVHLVPPLAVAESLAEALMPYAPPQADRPTRMLLVRAEEGREVLPDRLRAAGAEVTIATAYRNVIPAGSVERLRLLLAAGSEAFAAVTFTSASTVRHLLTLCEAAGVRLPTEALRVSIGPVTSEALRMEGLPPHAEAAEATVASLAKTVWEALKD